MQCGNKSTERLTITKVQDKARELKDDRAQIDNQIDQQTDADLDGYLDEELLSQMV